jgi:3-oxoacyl-[acyl-carrier protein] reductase
MDLRRVVCITGASQGIGRALVEEFVANGYNVSYCDMAAPFETGISRFFFPISSWLDSIFPYSHLQDDARIFYCKCNVAAEDEVKHWIEATVRHYGRLDCLINNAGISNPYYDLFDVTHWHTVLAVNLTGIRTRESEAN